MESQERLGNIPAKPPNIFLNLIGNIVVVLWLMGHAVYILMGFMASVMSIEAGRNSIISMNMFVYGFMFAQILTAISGFYIGLLISKVEYRKKNFTIFCLYFFSGIALKITVLYLWFN